MLVHPASDQDRLTSDWEVYFRNGILRWTEARRVRSAEACGSRSSRLHGDFDVFRGSWQVAPAAGGCIVTFDAEFDFGIPSLAGILDPIAGRVLTETIGDVVAGLLGAVTVLGDGAEPGHGPALAAQGTRELTIGAA